MKRSGVESSDYSKNSTMQFAIGDHWLFGKRFFPAQQPYPKASPWLIFLHEGLGSVAQWGMFPQELCDVTSLPGLAYDRPGYGKSSPSGTAWNKRYLHHEAETILPTVLRQCSIERAVLVGHSDGGSIALLYAAAFPERVAAVITLAAHVFVEDITISGIEETVRSYRSADLKRKLATYHGDMTEDMFYRWANLWRSPSFRSWNIEDVLSRITCPLLVIQGENDEYASQRQAKVIAAGVSGPSKLLMLAGCSHAPHREKRLLLLSSMAAFVNESLPGQCRAEK